MNLRNMMIAGLLVFMFLLSACEKNPSANKGTTGDWVWADRYEGTFSDQGYYYPDSSFLSYLDTASGKTTILCSKAGCLHDQESCDAFLSGLLFDMGGSCFWDGSLYYLEHNAYGLSLYRCNATGTERTIIGELATKYMKEQKAITPQKYALADGFWYYCAVVKNPVWNEEKGIWINQQDLNYISRIDLRTGKEDILIEDQENTLNLCAVQKNAILYTSQGIPNADIRDPAYQEQLKEMPVLLQCWDGETGQITTLFQKSSRECGGVKMVFGGKVYYPQQIQTAESTYAINTHTYDLATGKEALFVEGESMWYWGGGYAQRQDAQTKTWYLFSLESGNKLPIYITDSGLRMECATQRGCILKLLESGVKSQYCYVSYESMSDGLQETDLMPFKTVYFN